MAPPAVEERRDVWVIEAADGAGLALKSSFPVRIAGDLRRQDFDGDDAIETDVDRLVDFAHAAGAHERPDAIRTETRVRGDCQRLGNLP